MKFYRYFAQQDLTDEITEGRWMAAARDNVHDVQLALENGFDSPGAHYYVVND